MSVQLCMYCPFCIVLNVCMSVCTELFCPFCPVMYCTLISTMYCLNCTFIHVLYCYICIVRFVLYCLFVCLSVLYVCVLLFYAVLSALFCTVLYWSACLPACMSVWLPVRLSVCLSVISSCRLSLFRMSVSTLYPVRPSYVHVVDNGKDFYVDRQCGLILYLYLFFSRTQRPTYDRLSELHSGCSIHSIVNESLLSCC